MADREAMWPLNVTQSRVETCLSGAGIWYNPVECAVESALKFTLESALKFTLESALKFTRLFVLLDPPILSNHP